MSITNNYEMEDPKDLTVYLGGIEKQVSRWIEKEIKSEIKKEVKRDLQQDERSY